MKPVFQKAKKMKYLLVAFSLFSITESKNVKYQLPNTAYNPVNYNRGPANVNAANMDNVPVPRSDYIPKKTVKCAYQHMVPNTHKLITAEIKIDTKRPTINLDNFVQIKTVDCLNDLLKLRFDNSESAQKAYESWSVTKNLIVMLGHQHRCKDLPLVSTLEVEKIMKPEGIVMFIDTVEVDAKDIMTEYELDITEVVTPAFAKRNGLTRNHSKTLNIPFNINFNRVSQKPVFSRIPLRTRTNTEISCIDCYTDGDISIAFHIKATLLEIREYRVRISGDIKLNMDLEFMIGRFMSFFSPPINLWKIPLTPITVPGVFNFGPELSLDTGLFWSVTIPTTVMYGFDLKLNFDYEISSDKGLSARPILKKRGTPIVKEHPLQLNKDIKVKINARLVPSIGINLSVLKVPAFDMRLELNNSIGVAVRTRNLRECPEEILNIELYHQHDFFFRVIGPTFENYLPIYESGELPIKCLTCFKCSDTKLTRLPIANGTTVTVTSSVRSIDSMKTTRVARGTNTPSIIPVVSHDTIKNLPGPSVTTSIVTFTQSSSMQSKFPMPTPITIPSMNSTEVGVPTISKATRTDGHTLAATGTVGINALAPTTGTMKILKANPSKISHRETLYMTTTTAMTPTISGRSSTEDTIDAIRTYSQISLDSQTAKILVPYAN
jgi:hypothetical protein